MTSFLETWLIERQGGKSKGGDMDSGAPTKLHWPAFQLCDFCDLLGKGKGDKGFKGKGGKDSKAREKSFSCHFCMKEWHVSQRSKNQKQLLFPESWFSEKWVYFQ